MKKVFYFSLMVMAMFVMTACSSSSSPGDAMKKYGNYLIQGDYEKFVDVAAVLHHHRRYPLWDAVL